MVKKMILMVLVLNMSFVINGCNTSSSIDKKSAKYIIWENEEADLYINVDDVIKNIKDRKDCSELILFLTKMPKRTYRMKGATSGLPVRIPDDVRGLDIDLYLEVSDLIPSLLKKKKIFVYNKYTHIFSTYNIKIQHHMFFAKFKDGRIFYTLPTYPLEIRN